VGVDGLHGRYVQGMAPPGGRVERVWQRCGRSRQLLVVDPTACGGRVPVGCPVLCAHVVAVSEMVSAISNIKSADYLTPYDHPVRYDDEYYLGMDLPHWGNKIFLSGSRHYRPHESTCLTFTVGGKTIKEDMDLHLKYSPGDKKNPDDRELFRHLQQLGGYVDDRKRRLLVGPMPSLATHVHLPYLAPIVDWEKLAKKTSDDYHKLISSL